MLLYDNYATIFTSYHNESPIYKWTFFILRIFTDQMTIYILLLTMSSGIWDLSCPTRDRTHLPAVEVQIPNHWPPGCPLVILMFRLVKLYTSQDKATNSGQYSVIPSRAAFLKHLLYAMRCTVFEVADVRNTHFGFHFNLCLSSLLRKTLCLNKADKYEI